MFSEGADGMGRFQGSGVAGGQCLLHCMSLQVAHRDRRRFDGQPSLSGHCGHGQIFIAQGSVANDPLLTWPDHRVVSAEAATLRSAPSHSITSSVRDSLDGPLVRFWR